ncbi:MAG TPA: transcriptional regulator [Actinotalea sp.]|nr:transcriptional regulator [Actinotalea sp.]
MTVVTEAALEPLLTKDFAQFEVHGYTVVDARGWGESGVRDAGWDATANIRIEIVCKPEAAAALIDHLQATYYANFAMVVFTSEVHVLRAEKF